MKEVIEFLNANSYGFLATEENGKPHVRPWGFMFEQDGKLWFCTANSKDVFRQLQKNPAIEFSSSAQSFVTVRVSGEVKFSRDLEMKKKIIESNNMVKSVYQTPDNPVFEIFYLEHGQAIMSDFSGQPPKIFEF
jgi:uncharacterized pyridoxamine 5'-phosphate oxidase family protein